MAMGRLNRPSIMVYGGSIHSGRKGNRSILFQLLKLLEKNLYHYQKILSYSNSCPGACGGMYTANTMSSAIEALGMSLPYSSSNPALSQKKKNKVLDVGRGYQNFIRKDIKPRDIMT
jgi:dihydroxy-acid dehydratase